MDGELLPWTEKYRPKRLKDVAGQENNIDTLGAFARKKDMPNLLFAGPPGVGKTTATLALAHEMYGNELDGKILELNASDERGIDIVRGKIKDFARSVSLRDIPFKIVFLDEADALTPEAQHALRRTMEVYSGQTRFILSCNYSSKIIEPIQSRCAIFRFVPLKEADVRRMLDKISGSEGLEVGKDAYDAIFYVSDGDMRKAVNTLQGASIHSKKITAETVYKISSRARPKEIREMAEHALKGEFMRAREKLNVLMMEYGLSGEDVILQLYREVANLDIPEKRKVHLVDRIGEYNFRLVEGANERIQVEALLAQLGIAGKE